MFWGSEYFQIRHGKTENIGELTPTGTSPLNRGLAMKRSDETYSEVGEGDMTGFLAQKVTTAGPSFEDLNFKKDLDALMGHKVSLISLEDGGEFEVEGEPSKAYTDSQNGLVVTSGTGAIAADTAAGTQLSVKSGRWYQAQTGDFVLAILRKVITGVADSSNIRILCEMRRSGIKVS